MPEEKAWKALQNMEIVDIGSGHGEFLNGAHIAHGCAAVGIEIVPVTFKGSLIHGKKFRDKNDGKVTFITTLGNAGYLTDFGGAHVAYAWLKGAPREIIQHILEVFLKDEAALYYITHVGNYAELYPKKLRMLDHGCWQFSGFDTGSMTLYVYGKTEYNGKRKRVRKVSSTWRYNEPSKGIRWSFKAVWHLRNTPKESEEYKAFADRLYNCNMEKAEVEHEKQLTRMQDWRLNRNKDVN